MQVMRLQVEEVRHRLREKRIDLQLTDRALEHALEEAFDPAFGARPLKRYLEKHIVSELSVMLLSGSNQFTQHAWSFLSFCFSYSPVFLCDNEA